MRGFDDEEERVIKEILQKIYPRWEAIRKAKKLVDSNWLNEIAEKLPDDRIVINIIEALLAGNSIDSMAEDAFVTPEILINHLKSWGIIVDETIGYDD